MRKPSVWGCWLMCQAACTASMAWTADWNAPWRLCVWWWKLSRVLSKSLRWKFIKRNTRWLLIYPKACPSATVTVTAGQLCRLHSLVFKNQRSSNICSVLDESYLVNPCRSWTWNCFLCVVWHCRPLWRQPQHWIGESRQNTQKQQGEAQGP